MDRIFVAVILAVDEIGKGSARRYAWLQMKTWAQQPDTSILWKCSGESVLKDFWRLKNLTNTIFEIQFRPLNRYHQQNFQNMYIFFSIGLYKNVIFEQKKTGDVWLSHIHTSTFAYGSAYAVDHPHRDYRPTQF